jgi:tRNA uridine 5-carboxymethylaminomethyl modification enzyme
MFTSRAEYRLLLREDNADLRLSAQGRELGLVDDLRWRAFESKRGAIEDEQQRLRKTLVRPQPQNADLLERVLGATLNRECSAAELLRRPEVSYRAMMTLPGLGPGVADDKVAEQIEIQARYHGYIERQSAEVAKSVTLQETPLPDDVRYEDVRGLSTEVCEKLSRQRPATVGQASRIDGVTPAAISLLLVHLKKRTLERQPSGPVGEGTRRRA